MYKKGYKHPEKTKKKMSLAHQGKNNPMYGITPWNKGLTKEVDERIAKCAESYRGFKHSKETKQRISETHKGKKLSERHKENLRKNAKNNPNYGMKNKKHSKETVCKMSEVALGRPPWNTGLGYSGMTGKHHSEKTKQKMSIAASGENNLNWKGGISFEPYPPEFNNRLKREIRKRDNYQCQLCGIPENGRAHDVHHINYNKKDSSKRNLIALCHSHNEKANAHREKWQFLFETLQEIRQI